MHFKMLSAICFNLDQSKIVLSGNGLKRVSGLLDTSPIRYQQLIQLEHTQAKGGVIHVCDTLQKASHHIIMDSLTSILSQEAE